MRRRKYEARWRYFASGRRWHLVEVMRDEHGQPWISEGKYAIMAPFSVCGNARPKYGAGWALFSPSSGVRCSTCRRLASKFRITNSADEKRG